MKRLLTGIAVLGLFAPIDASAAPGHGRGHEWAGPNGPPSLAGKPSNLPPVHARKVWREGERIPMFYVAPQYYIAEPSAYLLAAPPAGHRWINVDGDAYLVQVASGVVLDLVVVGPMEDARPSPLPVIAEREDRLSQR
jgi:Ni/Co efflux regulator RcnB